MRCAALAAACSFTLLICFPVPTLAQGTRSDYERAARMPELVRNKVRFARIDPRWYGTRQSSFWYRRELADGNWEFISVDAEKGVRQNAFNHDKLAAELSRHLRRNVDPKRLPLEMLTFDGGGDAFRFNAESKGYQYEIATHQVSETDVLKEAEPRAPDRGRRGGRGRARGDESPDGWKSVEVRDHNLVLRQKGLPGEHVLTTDGTADAPYESGVVWSPDSARFVALKTTRPETHTVYLIESSPRDQVQPKLHSHDYLKPGDRIAHPRVCLFEVPAVDEVASAVNPANRPAMISDERFPNPWSIDEIRWAADSNRFTFAYNQRGHQALRILAVDVKSRAATAIVDETSKTFVDYAGKRFVEYLDETGELIWMSERSGWNHLYLYDAVTGVVKNPITHGDWVVRGVDRVNREARTVTFRASGMFPDQDPYYVHVGRVNFDGTGLVWLTSGDGTHTVEYSPRRDYLIDSWSRVDRPPTIVLRKVEDGSQVCELEHADASALQETGWKLPERFSSKGRDGATDIYGVIWRPTTFDADRRYPVIEYIYAGPHSAFTPKSFSAWQSPQSMAELGFIVVQIDGMGTSHRSKAFHDVCWKNLGDSGFPDRIAWIKAAAAQYPQMDLSKVGIYGGSAGGQSSTRALLAFGDFYKVAVSDCGCHDNRMDKIWWNELWMSYPVGDHYAEQSNVTNAHKLQGKLMLVVGELDRNVDPASTMQVADALIRADKDFDLLLIPGAGHGAAESPYGRRRRMDFFVRHLLGVEPRSQP